MSEPDPNNEDPWDERDTAVSKPPCAEPASEAAAIPSSEEPDTLVGIELPEDADEREQDADSEPPTSGEEP